MSKKYESVIGIEDGRTALLTAEASTGNSYDEVLKFGGLQTANMTYNVAEQVIYGDNVAIDTLREITSMTVDEQTAGETDELLAILEGHAQDAQSGELVDSTTDTAPFVGHSLIARYRSTTEAGAAEEGYKAFFFPKMKYAPNSPAYTAKTDSITPSTTTLNGTAYADAAGRVRFRKKFTTLAAAQAWVDEKFGVTE
jgi:hypothetical protein